MISEKVVRAAGMALVGAKWDTGRRIVGGEKLSAIQMAEYEAKAVLQAALPHLDEPGDPATIKRLLDDMDAENMPNERRAEILAIRIRRATPEEAAAIPALEEQRHGG